MDQASIDCNLWTGATLVDNDLSFLGQYVLTIALKNFRAAVYSVILEAAHGHFKPGIRTIGLAQGATGISKPSNVVPGPIVHLVDEQAKKLLSGQIKLRP